MTCKGTNRQIFLRINLFPNFLLADLFSHFLKIQKNPIQTDQQCCQFLACVFLQCSSVCIQCFSGCIVNYDGIVCVSQGLACQDFTL